MQKIKQYAKLWEATNALKEPLSCLFCVTFISCPHPFPPSRHADTSSFKSGTTKAFVFRKTPWLFHVWKQRIIKANIKFQTLYKRMLAYHMCLGILRIKVSEDSTSWAARPSPVSTPLMREHNSQELPFVVKLTQSVEQFNGQQYVTTMWIHVIPLYWILITRHVAVSAESQYGAPSQT